MIPVKLLETYKKIDIKILLIIILLLLSSFFAFKWYFNDDKSLIDNLHKQNNEIIQDRKRIKHEIDSLKKVNNLLVKDKTSIEDNILKVNKLLDDYINKANKSKYDLEKLKSDLNKIDNEIKLLESNPVKRTDDELLNSLKKHFEEREKKYKNK